MLENRNENITINTGQKFTISLESKPTSGFRWHPTSDQSIISLISHNFQPTSSIVIGSSGKDIFTLKAINPGATVLKMVYKRSWEQQFVAEKNFFINVR